MLAVSLNLNYTTHNTQHNNTSVLFFPPDDAREGRRETEGGRKEEQTHRSLHLNNLQPPIHLRHKIRRSRKRNTARPDQSPIQRRVLSYALTEGSALVVDREGGDLLREAEEEDGGVEQVGLEFGFEVDGAPSGVVE